AAKKEGVLSINHQPSSLLQNDVLGAFKEKYPWLKVEATSAPRGEFANRVLAEQRNGQYLWDVEILGGFGGSNVQFVNADALQDMRPLLARLPKEITDDSKWAGGFEMWAGPEHTHSLITQIQLQTGVSVNRSKIPTSELSSIDQILDPKFKGKIVTYSPERIGGATYTLAAVSMVKGEDFIKKLFFDQAVVALADQRQLAERVATGQYPIGLGASETDYDEYKAKGIGLEVEEIREVATTYLRASGITYFKNAPHPNAANVFMHWFLSQEGQDAWASKGGPIAVTRRLDVPVYHPKAMFDPSQLKDYKAILGTVESQEWLDRTSQIINTKP
ncbi:MAG TPA: extracellular solute-binding protein, partial [Thermomicrobiales bacterium]|nr:extracellular solute-binding protein [Thermomicrobiales bacterium]